jgi:hypothetical protein
MDDPNYGRPVGRKGITSKVDTNPPFRKDEKTLTTANAHVLQMRALLGRMTALRPSLGTRQEIVDLWSQAAASGYSLAYAWVLSEADLRRVCDGLQQMILFFAVNPTWRDDTLLVGGG